MQGTRAPGLPLFTVSRPFFLHDRLPGFPVVLIRDERRRNAGSTFARSASLIFIDFSRANVVFPAPFGPAIMTIFFSELIDIGTCRLIQRSINSITEPFGDTINES
jgi:hypothetical protein